MNIKVIKTSEDPLVFIIIKRYPNHGCELIKQALNSLEYNLLISKWNNPNLGKKKIPSGFLTITQLGADKPLRVRPTFRKYFYFEDDQEIKPPTSK